MKTLFTGLFVMMLVVVGCSAPPAPATPGAEGDRYMEQPEITGVVLSLHREGGLAGVCEDILITASGEVTITTCDGVSLIGEAGGQLDEAQLVTLINWASTYAGFEADFNDEVPVDGLANHLVFNGQGDVLAGDAEQQEMLAFAGEVYAQHVDLSAE